MKIFQKLAQKIYRYSTREVVDVESNKKEIAVYHKLFGIVIKTTYEVL